ncbi:MAG: dehydrogenase [Anaerocolumna sp.]|jgi:predicted dehydrogenase|nr:dehydrogenase [Anaerocolumna sp.]
MEKVKLGIIGYGVQGSTYARFLIEDKIPNMELGAICDIDEEKLLNAQTNHPGIPVFSDYISLLDSTVVDAVVITVPHYLHPVIGIDALKRDVHVMCEKPAGVYTKQVKELIEYSKIKPEITFAIMFNQRSNPLYQKVKEIMDSGVMGGLRRTNWIITSWWRPQSYYNQGSWRATWGGEGGGVLVNQAPHQLDLIQWLCKKPEKVYANLKFGFGRDIVVENEVTALLDYGNGATGVFITCTHDVLGTDRLEILCDNGKIVIEDSRRAVVKILKESENVMNEKYTMGQAGNGFRDVFENGFYDETVYEFPSVWGEQHCNTFMNFAAHILNGTPLIANGEEGMNGVRLASAMLLSGWLKKEVDYNFDDDLYIEELNKRIKEEGKYPTI